MHAIRNVDLELYYSVAPITAPPPLINSCRACFARVAASLSTAMLDLLGRTRVLLGCVALVLALAAVVQGAASAAWAPSAPLQGGSIPPSPVMPATYAGTRPPLRASTGSALMNRHGCCCRRRVGAQALDLAEQ